MRKKANVVVDGGSASKKVKIAVDGGSASKKACCVEKDRREMGGRE